MWTSLDPPSWIQTNPLFIPPTPPLRVFPLPPGFLSFWLPAFLVLHWHSCTWLNRHVHSNGASRHWAFNCRGNIVHAEFPQIPPPFFLSIFRSLPIPVPVTSPLRLHYAPPCNSFFLLSLRPCSKNSIFVFRPIAAVTIGLIAPQVPLLSNAGLLLKVQPLHKLALPWPSHHR